MLKPSRIVGAGLSGLLAAYAWPGIPILESSPTSGAEHQALLRFRSDAVSRLTGIPFRRVTVRKGVWSRGWFQSPSIALANMYSMKVLGRIVSDRSIWNLEPVERFIAPDDFYGQLVDNAGDRIQWGKPDDFEHGQLSPIISTAPLPIVMAAVDLPPVETVRAAITVLRFRVPKADVFQTVYFPDRFLPIYRASMTGDTLIIERTGEKSFAITEQEADAIRDAFDIFMGECVPVGIANQKYGKIVPLPDDVRKAILFRLTHEYGIYSLGRFAQWRNILLDDVINDIDVVKRLLQTGDKYDIALTRAGD